MAFQHWYCEKCGRESTVQHKKGVKLYEIVRLIEFHHGRKSKDCCIQNGTKFLRAGFPPTSTPEPT